MRSRAVRVTVMLLAVGVVAAAAYLFWNIDGRATRIAAEARSLNTRVSAAVRQTFDLRGAQQAYVSAGQNAQFWNPKVTTSIAALRESLTGLRGASMTASGRVALDGALQALGEFERMDQHAREYAADNQKLLASDLIFSDGLETTEEIVTALEQTRYVEAEDAAAARAATRRGQLMLAGGAALITLGALILLVPAPRVPAAPVTSPAAFGIDPVREAGRSAGESTAAPVPASDAVEEFEFRPMPGRGQTRQPEPKAEPLIPVPGPVAAQRPEPEPSTDLEPVAAVCRDLARLADTASLPSLLERTATVLGASGVMLWVADPDGRELTAIAAHGYSATMLSRLGTIKRDAENVTAAAFRTGLLQVLNADATSPGAIAAPLVNPSGCMGVMSAEVRHDGEDRPARVAIATILAAQLATLVAPSARAHVKSEAV